MKIDEYRLFAEIERVKPKRILFRCPDGYLQKVSDIASDIEEKYGVQVVVSADPCYGSCDVADEDAEKLKADLAFHLGHSSTLEKYGRHTVLIDVYDEVDFREAVEKALPTLKQHRRLGLCTISQHLNQINPVKDLLEKKGFEVYVGGEGGRLREGQVFGCRFNTVFTIRDKVDAFLFMGQSRFHALGVALSTGRLTFMLDPYLLELEDMSELSGKWLKKAILQVYRAREAERFGVIVGLKEGQMMPERALQIKKSLIDHGKKAQIIALREVKEDRLALFRNIDAFIQTACPRISIDGEEFSRPVLSAPQAEALIKVLDGREPEAFLEKSHWL